MQHQPSMKQVMSIIAERDAAIQERNLAISEKKAAVAERDMAFLQRDTAIAERNNAIMERDSALTALQYRENSMVTAPAANMSACPPGCQISRGVKHLHHPHMHHHHQQHHIPQLTENAYETREMEPNDGLPTSPPAGSTLESALPNKRHARVGGRKMSGSAFNKLLSRLAAEGHHDLSNPVDLKDHWAKHGTNRYITIK